MKFSIALAVAVVTGFTAKLVSCGNIPPEEALYAESIEEFERLRSHANSGMNDEIQRTEYLRRRLNEKSQPLLASYFGGVPGFYHGVASGDPLPDAVILWTRYTPMTATSVVTLELRISPVIPSLPVASHLDPALNTELRRVNIEVSAASDWIAKVDVIGLPTGTSFIYAFSDGLAAVSEVGQTKTAPSLDADTSQLIYAAFSCSHFANGYFHPYDVASTIKDLDFWFHVGDYVVRINEEYDDDRSNFNNFNLASPKMFSPLFILFVSSLRSMNTACTVITHQTHPNERHKSYPCGNKSMYKIIGFEWQHTI